MPPAITQFSRTRIPPGLEPAVAPAASRSRLAAFRLLDYDLDPAAHSHTCASSPRRSSTVM
jgi:hypothetical protein